jgi:hypothetical protein
MPPNLSNVCSSGRDEGHILRAISSSAPSTDGGSCRIDRRPRRRGWIYASWIEQLILCRHAMSDFNVRGVLNADPSVQGGLSDRGREQAKELGSNSPPRNSMPGDVRTAPMRRSRGRG